MPSPAGPPGSARHRRSTMSNWPEPGRLRDVESADVYKCGRLAGTLRRDGDDVVFTYLEEYRADPETPPIAFTLPKHSEAVRTTGGSVPPFFAGLLPEGARLVAITALTRTSEDDHLSLLLAVGADTVGDVQVLPTGLSLTEPPPLFGEDPATADFAEVFARATAITGDEFDRTALPGIQVKVSARMISTPVRTGHGAAILKLNPPEFPRLVENENFFLDMAAECGIRVPPHQLAIDRLGRAGLFVERFDRVVEGDGIRRLAQEDACQVLGRYPAAKYRISLQEAIKGLGQAVEAGEGSRRAAILTMLEIAAFSYLIGNGDLHGKNLSILRAPSGIWEVTPAYDLLTTQPYLSWKDPMALALYGRNARLGHRWWMEAAERLGVPRRALARSLARISEAAQPWIGRLGEIGFDEAWTRRLAELIEQRRQELSAPE
nr:HipA domain-containing protein [Nocardia farcinica]